MDRGRAGKVVESQLSQPAATPYPVRFDWVDERGDHCGIDAVRQKFCAFRHGAGNDRGCRGTKYKVEHKVGPVKIRICRKDIQSRLADKACQILAQQQSEADQNEHTGADAEVHEVFHQDIAGVFGAGKAALHHGKARLHPEHQSGSDQEPNAEGHA